MLQVARTFSWNMHGEICRTYSSRSDADAKALVDEKACSLTIAARWSMWKQAFIASKIEAPVTPVSRLFQFSCHSWCCFLGSRRDTCLTCAMALDVALLWFGIWTGSAIHRDKGDLSLAEVSQAMDPIKRSQVWTIPGQYLIGIGCTVIGKQWCLNTST